MKLHEIWIDAKGYEGHYMVSNYGEIKSIKNGKEKILKQTFTNYFVVCLSIDGVIKTHYVHRLVIDSFIGTDTSLVVNHKDSDPSNNHLGNLEYVTQAQNVKHGVDKYNYENNGKKKLSREDRADMKIMIWEGVKAIDIAMKYGVSTTNIYKHKKRMMEKLAA